VHRLLRSLAVFMIAIAGVVAVPAPASSMQTYEEVISNPGLTPAHSVIIRLYQAVFGRQPDVAGLTFWLDQFDSGEWNTRRIATFFTTAEEFRLLYGEDITNEEFVNAVYPNVLGRLPDAGGASFWIGFLDQGNSRAELILLISNAPEFIEANWLPSDGTPNPDSDDPTTPPPDALVSDSFAGTGPLSGYTTTNPEVLPEVGRVNGRYRAELTDNAADKTLHFNDAQGRLDAKLVAFPFDYVARNIGVGSVSDSQLAPNPSGSTFMFSGIQVHSTDLDAADSAHVVVGHRGNTKFTVEGKNTVGGGSSVNDVGANTAPDGRADIRIVGNSGRTLTVYWQTPNFSSAASDNWQLYLGTGNLPGSTAPFEASVYIGLITYAFGSGSVPFVGTADSVELVGE
jgi:hypothetical protein